MNGGGVFSSEQPTATERLATIDINDTTEW